MTYAQQCNEFKIRARKQILVAMREATEGEDFDQIIENEYKDIEPAEAKYVYLCIALASALHYKLSIRQVLAASTDRPPAVLGYIQRNLRGLIVSESERDDVWETRHPVIAELIVEQLADRSDLRQAYIRLLPVLAHDMPRSPKYGNRIFRLYRRLINHYEIYRRFSNEIGHARSIYESVKHYVNEDHHFWLQYGSLELEYGDLSVAANYIAQAESLRPYDRFVLTAKGHLRYRQAREADDFRIAQQLIDEGRELVLDQINWSPEFSPHPFHIYGSQEMAYVHKWSIELSRDEIKDILENALNVVETGVGTHRRSRDLKQLRDDLKREILSLAIPKG